MKPMSEQVTGIYQSVLNQFEKKAFICFDEEQYNNFTLKFPEKFAAIAAAEKAAAEKAAAGAGTAGGRRRKSRKSRKSRKTRRRRT